MTAAPLLQLEGLTRHYRLRRRRLLQPPGRVRALDGVDLELAAGASLGIVGESGCGKSTLARLAMALDRPSAGAVRFRGQDLASLSEPALRRLRRDFQMVFQDPYGSLDPRRRVGRIVAEPLAALTDLPRRDRAARVAEALEEVGLDPSAAERHPHAFSGGQRQRIAIARALITRPALIVADEPVSALDVSVRAQVLNLLRDLRARHGMAYMIISHDLAVIDYLCAETVVLYLGRIVEQGPTTALLAAPAHPYTRLLLEAVPQPGSRALPRSAVEAATPATGVSGDWRAGCAFAPRCPLAEERCRRETPALRDLGRGRRAACHLA